MVPPVSVTLEVLTTVVTLLWESVQMIVLVLELLTTNRQQPPPHPHHYHPICHLCGLLPMELGCRGCRQERQGVVHVCTTRRFDVADIGSVDSY